MLRVGDMVPLIEVLDQDGNLKSLKDWRGKKLVLYFYPKDMTPGCTLQAMNLTANLKKLAEVGYDVVGVSADSVKRHCKFIDKIDIGFTLLSDESMELIKAFGVWGPKKFMGRTYDGIKRTTFLIDKEGRVASVIEKVKTKSHSQQILDLIEEKNG